MKVPNSTARRRKSRRGGFTAVGAVCLVAAIAFAALSVDIGMIALTRTQLQNACDAAALAAAQEISVKVAQIGGSGGSPSQANSAAEAAARGMAVKVAGLNGVYLDPNRDVLLGRRVFDKTSNKFKVNWGSTPYNAVKVTAHRDNSNPKAQDAALNLLFAPLFGGKTQNVIASAAAFVEARDLILTLDYTASMNDDSTFDGMAKLGRSAVEANMLQIFSQLGLSAPLLPDTPRYVDVNASGNGGMTVTVTFKGPAVTVSSNKSLSSINLTFNDGGTQTFTVSGMTATVTGTGPNATNYVTKCVANSSGKSATAVYDTTAVKAEFGLNLIPYPYAGGSWDEFISVTHSASAADHVYGTSYTGGYAWKFGKLTFVNYLLQTHPSYSENKYLWKTPHYPFHAMKQGASLFCSYMKDLGYDDYIGLVTYDEQARTETKLVEPLDGTAVDISATPITNNYDAIDKIQLHKQAGHYFSMTGIGYGIDQAIATLQSYGRYGARPTILLMTDGNANVAPSGWKLPSGWDWTKLTDYDGNGVADYKTTDVNKLYAFYQAKRAIDLGYTIHTMTVGIDADRDLMKAIAFAGGGQYLDVPGGSTIASQETALKAAFQTIAANVPSAKLLIERP